MIFALRGKAIFAVEIASVRHVQTHCFKHRVALCKHVDVGFEVVNRKEFAFRFEFFDVGYALSDVLFAHALVFILVCNLPDDLHRKECFRTYR